MKGRRTHRTRTYVNMAGWQEIGGRRIYFRSMWEVHVALLFQFFKDTQQILDWEYEPKTFWFDGIKRGQCSYKPDFRLTRIDLSTYWVEVKGYMCASSLTKLRRFKRYFPDEEMHLIEKEWIRKHQNIIPSLEDIWIIKPKLPLKEENET